MTNNLDPKDLVCVQNDTLKNGDCIFGIKKNEWIIYENN